MTASVNVVYAVHMADVKKTSVKVDADTIILIEQARVAQMEKTQERLNFGEIVHRAVRKLLDSLKGGKDA